VFDGTALLGIQTGEEIHSEGLSGNFTMRVRLKLRRGETVVTCERAGCAY
jgi:hypothetical protein